jgi:DNA-binding PadR family transcriptional regulator
MANAMETKRPVSKARSGQELKLTPPSYLVLGMVRLGASSGYAIKKAADASTQNIWPTSLAQVYPELARLEREGLVSRRENPHGARARSAYRLTEKGEAAFQDWLRSTELGPLQFRDEGSLRLFFADALPREEQLALVQRLLERARGARRHLREELIPNAESTQPADAHYPALVGRLGADSWAHWERWFARLEARLSDDASVKPD